MQRSQQFNRDTDSALTVPQIESPASHGGHSGHASQPQSSEEAQSSTDTAAAAVAAELSEVRSSLAARIEGGEQRIGELTAMVAKLQHGAAMSARNDGDRSADSRLPHPNRAASRTVGTVTTDTQTHGDRGSSGDGSGSAIARARDMAGTAARAAAAATAGAASTVGAASLAQERAAEATTSQPYSRRRRSRDSTAPGLDWRSSTARARLDAPAALSSGSIEERVSEAEGGAPATARSAAAVAGSVAHQRRDVNGNFNDQDDWSPHEPLSGNELPPRMRRSLRPVDYAAQSENGTSAATRLERQLHERAAAAAMLQSRLEALTASMAEERAQHSATLAQLEAQQSALRSARDATQRAEADAAALRARVVAAGDVEAELMRARSDVRRLETALSELASSPFGATARARDTELETLRARCQQVEAARADADARAAAAVAALQGARQEVADAQRREQTAAAAELAANAQTER